MALTQIHGQDQIQAVTIDRGRLEADFFDGTNWDPTNGNTNATITGLPNPVSTTDVATKGYVDGLFNGRVDKQSVQALASSNIASLSGTTTIDGVALSINDRVLLTAQTSANENGIWVIQSGGWTRPADFATASGAAAATVLVQEGTTHADEGYTCTNDTGSDVVDTDNLVWVQTSGAGATQNASTSVKGIVEEATQTEVEAGTGTGGTGGRLFISPERLYGAGNFFISKTGIAGLQGDTLVRVLSLGTAELTGANTIITGSATVRVTAPQDQATLFNTPSAGATGLEMVNASWVLARIAANAGNNIARNEFSTPGNGVTLVVAANTPIVGTMEVFRNGVLQEPGAGNDYTISGSNITLAQACTPNTKIALRYEY